MLMVTNWARVISFRLLFLEASLYSLFVSPPETDIDDCASHPCKNNGTCTERVNVNLV